MAPDQPVWIERIDVENLGPIGSCGFELGKLNLFYGHNEVGKTYLVEFIIRSLFLHVKEWVLRSEIGQGKVQVSGLDSSPVDFTPSSHRKLEDYWSSDERGLPGNMARLLVVKGGELDFDRNIHGGVDRSILKGVLSSEGLLDRIVGPIQKTVRAASVESGEIIGNKSGQIKAREEKRDQLVALDRLFDEVNQRVSGGPVQALRLRSDRLQEELRHMIEAKQYLAYRTHQSLTELKTARSELPDDELVELEQALRDRANARAKLDGLRPDIDSVRSEASHSEWLEQAVRQWEDRNLADIRKPSRWLFWAGFVAVAAGLVLALGDALLVRATIGKLALAAVSALSCAAGLIMLWLHSTRTRPDRLAALDMADRVDIEGEFEARFGRLLGGLADLKAQSEQARDANAKMKVLDDQLNGLRDEIGSATTVAQRKISQLTGGDVAEEKWEDEANELRAKSRGLDDEIRATQSALDRLGVDPSDFDTEPTTVEYSEEAENRIEATLQDVNNRLEDAKGDLAKLKGEVVRQTGDVATVSWEDALANLRALKLDTETGYRDLTANVLAQIGVVNVVEELRKQEDERIRTGLKDSGVLKVLEDVTGRYESLDLDKGTLIVGSATADYPVSELSTGAREQVLIALRMGFASRLAGGKPLFLVLDDAFQHSDWPRREKLVENVISAVEAGWQVTYLTMDDHLRDLFKKAGKKALDKDFKLHQLS